MKPEPCPASKDLDRRARHSLITLLFAMMRLKSDASLRNWKPAASFARRDATFPTCDRLAGGWTHVFPPQGGVTVFTVDVSDGVKPGEQQPLLCWAAAHVHPAENKQQFVDWGKKTKCLPVPPRRLWDEITWQSYLTTEQRASVILTH